MVDETTEEVVPAVEEVGIEAEIVNSSEVVEEPVSRNKDDLASFLIMWLLLLGSTN